MSQPSSSLTPSPVSGLSEREVLLTLFDLGRRVASVIDLDELLQRLPELIGRIIQFDAFAVYLLDEKRQDLRIAYAVGYPDTSGIRLTLSQGLVGRVISTQQAQVLGDIRTDTGYVEVVGDVPAKLRHPMPISLTVWGAPGDEPTLIKVASAYEAATHHREAPPMFPPLKGKP